MSDPDSEKTRLIRRSSASSSGPPSSSQGAPSNDPEETVYVHEHSARPQGEPDETRIIGREPVVVAVPQSPPEDERTVLVRPSSRHTESKTPATDAAADDFLPEGPVVGWLVVVSGPGRGRSVSLGYGMNSIGRDSDNRVALSFGDELISRKKHATLTYDPRGKKFFLQHGESSNLTYLGEDPVLAPVALGGGETIRLGDATELRFIPLCGEDFDWEEGE